MRRHTFITSTPNRTLATPTPPSIDSGIQHHGTPLSDVPTFEECKRRTPEGENIPLALMSKLDLRLHPEDRGFAIGQPSGVPRIRGWFTFAAARVAAKYGAPKRKVYELALMIK